MLAVNMGILGEGILAGDMRTRSYDFVDNPLGCLDLTRDKTKQRPWALKCCMRD